MPRLTVVALITAGLVIPAALAHDSATNATSVQALDAAVLVQLNAIRQEHGLVQLKPNAALTVAASVHSAQMLADGYFSHISHDGSPFWKRLVPYTSRAPSKRWSVGENLLWSSPGVDATRALALWMASAEHKRNILAARWRDVGVAAMHTDDAPGTYGGRPVTVITADFGVRQ